MIAASPAGDERRALDLGGLDVARALIAARDAFRVLAVGEHLDIVVDVGDLEIDQAIASYFEKRRRFYELERLDARRVRIRVAHPG